VGHKCGVNALADEGTAEGRGGWWQGVRSRSIDAVDGRGPLSETRMAFGLLG
jgi:hypothetical protein